MEREQTLHHSDIELERVKLALARHTANQAISIEAFCSGVGITIDMAIKSLDRKRVVESRMQSLIDLCRPVNSQEMKIIQAISPMVLSWLEDSDSELTAETLRQFLNTQDRTPHIKAILHLIARAKLH
ncbi:hypothetical protein [uncultured Photobacterium sp.]|uniref:hypothetical protein n=1 Tax=uncultured Photobacterium sp. TaxID=173973 RepID=UPI002613C95D|nr:hypothetical protein [uncultured Photobacterium sp.]